MKYKIAPELLAKIDEEALDSVVSKRIEQMKERSGFYLKGAEQVSDTVALVTYSVNKERTVRVPASFKDMILSLEGDRASLIEDVARLNKELNALERKYKTLQSGADNERS